MYSICLIFLYLRYLSAIPISGSALPELPSISPHFHRQNNIRPYRSGALLNVKLKVIHKKHSSGFRWNRLKKDGRIFPSGVSDTGHRPRTGCRQNIPLLAARPIAAQKAHRCIGAQIDAVAHGLKPSYHILHAFLLIHVKLMPAVETQGCQTALLLCVQTGLHLFKAISSGITPKSSRIHSGDTNMEVLTFFPGLLVLYEMPAHSVR